MILPLRGKGGGGYVVQDSEAVLFWSVVFRTRDILHSYEKGKPNFKPLYNKENRINSKKKNLSSCLSFL